MSEQGWTAFGAAVARDHALARLLLAGPLTDLSLERQLTALRRRLLLNGASAAALPALAVLAHQGFLNGYAWLRDAEEEARLAELRRAFAAGGRDDGLLLTLAGYQPLAELPHAKVLLTERASRPVAAVVRQQVAEPLRERELAADIAMLTSVEGAAPEGPPEPRWTQPGTPGSQTSQAIDLLVAGCGTGQGAVAHALQNPSARILAIDPRRASLGYAQRMADEFHVRNITFAQADPAQLGGFGGRFHVIVCSGALQRVADPVATAGVLAGLLRPGGSMTLEVPSAASQRPLHAARTLARNYPPTPEGVRALRQAVQQAPEGDPVRAALRAPGFFSTGACRDLLMPAHDHEFTTSTLRRLLDAAGLEFRGFGVEPAVSAAYAQAFPGDPGVDLEKWELFEARNPSAFAGVYRLWASKPR